MRIAIGVHSTDTVNSTVYFNHIMMFSKWAKEFELAFVGLRRVKVERACNMTVDTARKLDCTHVLFIDDDHILMPNMLPLLAENADAAVVSGLICKRLFPYETVAFQTINDNFTLVQLKPNTGVREVEGGAFGCTLINLSRLTKLKDPLFVTNGEQRYDVNFFRNVHAAGERIVVDTRVSVGHIGDPPVVWPENATRLRTERINRGLPEKR